MRCLSCNSEFVGIVLGGKPVSEVCDKCQEGETVFISRDRLSLLAGEFFNDHSPNLSGEPCGCELCAALAAKEKAEGALCRAREVYNYYAGGEKWRTAFIDKLSEVLFIDSSPCPHDEEAKRLREEVEWAEIECKKGELHARTLITELRARVAGKEEG